jgi:hypothetical protein
MMCLSFQAGCGGIGLDWFGLDLVKVRVPCVAVTVTVREEREHHVMYLFHNNQNQSFAS